METSKLIPARKFGPGYFIREQMDYRNMSIDKLAKVLKVTNEQINIVLDDKQPLSIEMALTLANVFGTSQQYWTNLDLNYRTQIQ
jgi:HTH-type transcriptional regulator/antitoxin HigA